MFGGLALPNTGYAFRPASEYYAIKASRLTACYQYGKISVPLL